MILLASLKAEIFPAEWILLIRPSILPSLKGTPAKSQSIVNHGFQILILFLRKSFQEGFDKELNRLKEELELLRERIDLEKTIMTELERGYNDKIDDV